MQKDSLKQLIESTIVAREFGFEWPNLEMILEQASSEIDEIREAVDNNELSSRIQEEMGDLLHTAISLCIFSEFDIDETLAKTSNKFGSRMSALKVIAEQRGYKSLKGQSTEFLLELWHEAKKMAP